MIGRHRKRLPWSLQARLAIGLAGVMVLAVALAGIAIAWRAIATVNLIEDQALQSQARDIARHLVVAANGQARVELPPALDSAYRYSRNGDLYAVLDSAGRAIAASSAEAARIASSIVSEGRSPGFFQSAPGDAKGGPIYGFIASSGAFRVVVAQGSGHRDVLIDSLLQEFSVAGLWLLAPIGAAAILVGELTIRRGLRPLTAASAAAEGIGPQQPRLRLPAKGLPREILPLVAAVNAALDRLAKGLETQRRFTADAAHELRTPLAVLTARLDNPTIGDVAALRRDVDRMNRLVSQLLKIARLDGLPLDIAQPVKLREVAIEATSLLAPLTIREGKELALLEPAPSAMVRGNHAALVTAVINLIENAVTHSPAGATVEVAIGERTICVLDRGPGVAPAEREAIFQRFHRGPGTGGAGAGLGLAIVAEIAAAHDGAVSISDREGGGAAFTLVIGRA